MHRTARFPSSLVAFIAVCLGSSARADVWVVDAAGAPGSDFPTIQGAVNVAAEGDTVLVRPGTYLDRVRISGKSLVLAADGAGVDVTAFSFFAFGFEPTIRVSNLDAGQTVVVRGFRLASGVEVQDCDGSVWFDEIEVTGVATCYDGNVPGAVVEDSGRVTFTHSVLTGQNANSIDASVYQAAAGLEATRSTVQLFDCEVLGGFGQNDNGFLRPSTPGAGGVRLRNATVTLIGCTVEGGAGGLGPAPVCSSVHEDGGPGIAFLDNQGVVRSAASTAVGGVANLATLCPGQTAPAGPPITGPGTVVPLPGFARHLRANSPVRGGATLTLELEGQPGEVPLVLVSASPEALYLPSYGSTLLVGFPLEDTLVLPALPASGQASLSLAVPNVGAVVGAVQLFAQPVFLDPLPRVWLGNGATFLLLDAGI